jgi:hypothetical protein
MNIAGRTSTSTGGGDENGTTCAKQTHTPPDRKRGENKKALLFLGVCVLNAQAVLCCEANAVALPPLYRSSLII